MLMLLLALIDLGRTKVTRATRWLWMALSGSLWLGGTACEDPLPQVEYGAPADFIDDRDVPPVDVPVADVKPGDVPGVDVPVVPDVPPDCGIATYYGPQPCETDAQCVEREGPGWYCDTANTFSDGCGGQVLWPLCRPGDVPLDAVTPDVPADAPRDCPPVVAYGPPPCTDDRDCEPWGEDYVCDKAHPVTDPCSGGQWYQCVQGPAPTDVVEPSPDAALDALPADLPAEAARDCPPMGWYGPPPCTSDAECQQDYGPDWYCKQDNPVPDGCGGTSNYPLCTQKAP